MALIAGSILTSNLTIDQINNTGPSSQFMSSLIIISMLVYPIALFILLVTIPVYIYTLYAIRLAAQGSGLNVNPARRSVLHAALRIVSVITLLLIVPNSITAVQSAIAGGDYGMVIGLLNIPFAILSTAILIFSIRYGRRVDGAWKTPFWITFSVVAVIACIVQDLIIIGASIA